MAKVKCAVCKKQIDNRGFWKHKKSHESQRVSVMSGSAEAMPNSKRQQGRASGLIATAVPFRQQAPLSLMSLFSAVKTQVQELNQTIEKIEEQLGFSL